MSSGSFQIPPLSSGVQFDVAPLMDGMSQIGAAVAPFPAMIEQGIDAPFQDAAGRWRDAAGKFLSVEERIAAGVSNAGEQIRMAGEHGGEGFHQGIHHGILGAEAAMALFPPLVVELIENPALGAIAAVKEGLSELFNIVSETAHHYQDINLGSMKSGLDPVTFSTYAAAAKASGVEISQFTMGLDLMAERAAAALEGDEKAAKGFYALGVSAAQLKEGLTDPKSLLLAVADGMAAIPTQGERSRAAMEAMGRQGRDLVPFLQQGSAGIQDMASHLGGLGAAVDENEAKTGAAWAKMTAEFDAMWESVKKAISEPIFEFLDQNMASIQATVQGLAKELGGNLGETVKTLIAQAPQILESVISIGEAIINFIPVLTPILDIVGQLLNLLAPLVDLLGVAGSGLSMIGHAITGNGDGIQADAGRAAASLNRFGRDAGFGSFGLDERPWEVAGTPVRIENHLHVDADALGRSAGEHAAKATRQTFDQYSKSLAASEKQHKISGNFGRPGGR